MGEWQLKHLVLAALLVVLVAVSVSPVASAEILPPTDSVSSGHLFDGSDPVFVAGHKAAEESVQRDENARATATSGHDRVASRASFEDLGATEARRLAADSFPELAVPRDMPLLPDRVPMTHPSGRLYESRLHFQRVADRSGLPVGEPSR
jgi:hypothetical protein